MRVTSRILSKGGRYILAVRPLEWYAGSVGVGAVVEEVSDNAVYVLFDNGLRESFPPIRFAEYFAPEDHPAEAVPKANGDGTAGVRTASGKILHH